MAVINQLIIIGNNNFGYKSNLHYSLEDASMQQKL